MEFNNRKLSSMVLNESVMSFCDRLAKIKGVEEAWKVLHVFTDYGLYGIEPPEDDDTLAIYNLGADLYSIKLARDRYNKAVESGKRGGRKKIETNDDEIASLLESGYTYQQISERLNISVSTLKRRIAAIKELRGQNSNDNFDTPESVKRVQKGPEGFRTVQKGPQGFTKVLYHNVNVNVNANDTVNENLFTRCAGNDPLKDQNKRTYNLTSQAQNTQSLIEVQKSGQNSPSNLVSSSCQFDNYILNSLRGQNPNINFDTYIATNRDGLWNGQEPLEIFLNNQLIIVENEEDDPENQECLQTVKNNDTLFQIATSQKYQEMLLVLTNENFKGFEIYATIRGFLPAAFVKIFWREDLQEKWTDRICGLTFG